MKTCPDKLQTYGLKYRFVVVITDPIPQGKVKGIIFSFHDTNVLLGCKHNVPLKLEKTYPELSSSGEIFAILMETDSHHPVSGIESFFYSVTMMYIDVDVKHAIMISSCSLAACLWQAMGKYFTVAIPECLIQYLYVILS
jgi:hypothetical protein